MGKYSHVDRFPGLLCFEKLILGLFESTLIFQEHGVLEVNLQQFLSCPRVVGQVKGVLERPVLQRIVDCLIHETKLLEELCALLPTQVNGPRKGDLLGSALAPVQLCDPGFALAFVSNKK